METIDYNPQITVDKKKVPPGIYFLAILLLIPFIGVIAAIVFTILGVAHYKSKTLTVVGILGMLLSIGFLVFLVHLGRQRIKKRKTITVQSQINDLSVNIELYKRQQGAYPERLKQILRTGYLPIVDLLIPKRHFSGKNFAFGYYHYQKIGDKYTLFSVGPDGIPYTADDIYPNLPSTDTGGFGLIHAPQP